MEGQGNAPADPAQLHPPRPEEASGKPLADYFWTGKGHEAWKKLSARLVQNAVAMLLVQVQSSCFESRSRADKDNAAPRPSMVMQMQCLQVSCTLCHKHKLLLLQSHALPCAIIGWASHAAGNSCLCTVEEGEPSGWTAC